MINELNPPGVELWINQQMATAIEDAFKRVLNSEEVYYYYHECSGRPGPCNGSEHRMVWFGRGLIPFIKKLRHRVPMPFMIMATSSKTKYGVVDDGYGFDKKTKEWVRLYDYKDFREPYYSNTYWIGDMSFEGDMICGDKLFNALVDRIKEKKTRQLRRTWGSKKFYNP